MKFLLEIFNDIIPDVKENYSVDFAYIHVNVGFKLSLKKKVRNAEEHYLCCKSQLFKKKKFTNTIHKNNTFFELTKSINANAHLSYHGRLSESLLPLRAL